MDFGIAVERLDALGRSALQLLPGLGFGALVFLLFLVLARVLRSGATRAVRLRSQAPGIALVAGRIVSGLTILVGLLVGAAVAFPSVGPSDLFSVLGFGGVAIGFAFRDILQNMLAGILILVTRPFRLGDQIRVAGFEGTVETIEIRATEIRTYDNRRAVIPNATIFSGSVLVNTAYDKRRLQARIGIGNGDDAARAKRLMEEAALSVEPVLADPAPSAVVVELGDFAVQVDLRFWIDPPMRGEEIDAMDAVLLAVKAALDGAGIDMPYPTQQVLFHDQTEETDGRRGRQREGWPAAPGAEPPAPRWQAPRRPHAGDRGEAAPPPAASG